MHGVVRSGHFWKFGSITSLPELQKLQVGRFQQHFGSNMASEVISVCLILKQFPWGAYTPPSSSGYSLFAYFRFAYSRFACFRPKSGVSPTLKKKQTEYKCTIKYTKQQYYIQTLVCVDILCTYSSNVFVFVSKHSLSSCIFRSLLITMTFINNNCSGTPFHDGK